jgi:hypothetical protein
MSESQQLLAIACQNITFTRVQVHRDHGEMLRLPSSSFDDLGRRRTEAIHPAACGLQIKQHKYSDVEQIEEYQATLLQ